MKLTGKCKKDFEKWFILYINKQLGDKRKDWGDDDEMIELFYLNLIQSMQYGVYVDFFDSVGVTINISPIYYDGYYYKIHIDKPNGEWIQDNMDSRPKARTKAIEKANEIYNKL